MNLGLAPVTGLPLPFRSCGGSSMFACWAVIGIVVAVSTERQVALRRPTRTTDLASGTRNHR